jgi:hypothetical protein
MRETPPKRDWTAFWIHFTFGAVVGFWVWERPRLELSNSEMAGALCVAGGAVGCGLLAGFGGQQFWKSLGR